MKGLPGDPGFFGFKGPQGSRGESGNTVQFLMMLPSLIFVVPSFVLLSLPSSFQGDLGVRVLPESHCRTYRYLDLLERLVTPATTGHPVVPESPASLVSTDVQVSGSQTELDHFFVVCFKSLTRYAEEVPDCCLQPAADTFPLTH